MPRGKAAGQSSEPITIAANATQTVSTRLTVARPQLWDIDHPYLYTLVSEVVEGKNVRDRYLTPFGVRTIAFDKEKGLLPEWAAR